RLPTPVFDERGVRRGTRPRRDPGGGTEVPAGPEGSAYGLEPRPARGGAAPLRGHPDGRPFLLRPLLLPCRSDGRELGSDRGWPAAGARGSGAPDPSRGVVRVRDQVRGRDRTGADLRDPVPSGEKPTLGAPAPRELRGDREGRRPVIIIPAIDLRGARCVRLHQGRADQETVFSEDPVAMAVHWKDLGAERLHVVDLDGAFAGEPRQTTLVAEIVEAVAPVPVQTGGGLRDLEAVGRALATGARWAVVGTRALEPDFLAEICDRFPQRIIVAVDARDGRVAVKGWVHLSELEPVEFAAALRDDRGGAARLAAPLHTDLGRDGTGAGPNVEATTELARAADVPVIASGGVARLDDLRRLAVVPGVVG